MHLLLINYEYPPIGGGAANATWHIAHELQDLGCQVTVLTSGYNGLWGETAENGIRVQRCVSLRRHRSTSNILEMCTFILSAGTWLLKTELKPINGIIAFFTFPCGPLALAASGARRIPYIISLRGGDVPGADPHLTGIHRLLSPLRRAILKNSAHVVANSMGLKHLAEKADPIPVTMIPNGIDTDFFTPLPQESRFSRPFKLLYVGRFQPEKNLFFLLDQLAVLHNSGASHHTFELHLVGDGPQKDALGSHARSLGLDTRIQWHGWLDKNQLRRQYQQADCLIMPSLYEGMSNVILEAFASGLPVIGSKVGGNPDLIQDHERGYLFDLDTPGDFHSKISHFLDDPALARLMGENARKWVLARYSWRQTAMAYIRLFKEQACH